MDAKTQQNMFVVPQNRLADFLLGDEGHTLTTWVKLAGVIGTCLYGLGTGVANGALVSLRTCEFTWALPQAIVTGFWSVFTLAVSMSPGNRCRPPLGWVGFFHVANRAGMELRAKRDAFIADETAW